MLPEELLWEIALLDTNTYHVMVIAIPQLARKITLGTQCDHKIHFGYGVKVGNYYDFHILWQLNGKLHRTDGPAVEYVNGDKEWRINGKRHRTDAPATEYSYHGAMLYCYYQNDKLHRIDGPAIERFYDNHKGYFINGINYSLQDYHLMTFNY